MSKPEINSTDINLMSRGKISPEQMPAGSVIQRRVKNRLFDVSTSGGSWVQIDAIDFTPYFANSLIKLTTNYSIGSQSNTAMAFRYVQYLRDDQYYIIEQSGTHYNGDTHADAREVRWHWDHYVYAGSNSPRRYMFEGLKPSGGIAWFHTYGSSATSYFSVEEIRQ